MGKKILGNGSKRGRVTNSQRGSGSRGRVIGIILNGFFLHGALPFPEKDNKGGQ